MRYVFFLSLLCFASVMQAQDSRVLDRIVAVIGDEIITESELQLQLLQQGIRDGGDGKFEAKRRQLLDAMMNDKLVLAQAVLDSVNIPQEEVTRRLEEQLRRLIRQFGSESKLEQVAGMNIAQMNHEFREDIRKRLMIESIQQQKFGVTEITHREVLDFFGIYADSLPPVPEQVELRQIAMFPRVTEQFREAARIKAQELLDSLRAGADFEDLARRYSDDVGSARNGGNLGLARRGVFVKEFEETAFALEPDQLSSVVETQFGFHIIKLLEKKGEAIRPSHILIKVEKTGESDQFVIDTLKALRQRIVDGASFEEMAQRYSEDEDTRKRGGSLGTIDVAELTDEMKAVQQNLGAGSISDPVKITFDKDYAYALIQLVQRIPQHAATLDRDYQRIANYAKVIKQNRQYAEWIEKIKENVYWKINI
jgi:peptidyl-prolyl cis-trans isomerase SurA